MSYETSKQTLIDNINTEIIENHANQITANVLNPILLAIVEWVSSALGDGDAIGFDNLVDEIASITSNSIIGFNVLTGTADPNTTPPGSFALGDFYKQTNGGGTTIGWFQYNGIEWAEIRRKTQEYYKNIRIVSASTAIQDDDFNVIMQGAGGYVFDQEIASDHPNRIITIINQAVSKNTFSQSYIQYDGSSTTDIPAQSRVSIHSDGTNWYQI